MENKTETIDIEATEIQNSEFVQSGFDRIVNDMNIQSNFIEDRISYMLGR